MLSPKHPQLISMFLANNETKEAINIIENEKTKKIEKPPQTTSNDQKQTAAPVRTTSQPPVRKLETIQERIPTYNDLRREKMERKVNVLNSLKLF